jgi:hypothetical protein
MVNMTYKQIIHEVDRIQISTFCTIDNFRMNKLEKYLPTENQGIYWFWTNLSNKRLKEIDTDWDTKEVPIAYLTHKRESLNGLCNYHHNDFRVVYSGISGHLRERILQEIGSSNDKKVTLNIDRRSNIKNWRISYFNFSDSRHQELLSCLGETSFPYYEYGDEIAKDWRLEFGWPLLNKM